MCIDSLLLTGQIGGFHISEVVERVLGSSKSFPCVPP